VVPPEPPLDAGPVGGTVMDARVLVLGQPLSVPNSWVEALTEAGATVTVVASGSEALRAFDVIQPDLMVIDVHLEGRIDGFDVCRELRSRSDALVVFAGPDPTSIEELVALAVGADGFFSGDVELSIVLAHLSSLLRRSRGGLVPGRSGGSGSVTSHPDRPVSGSSAVPDRIGRIIDADLEIDLVAREVRVAGSVTEMTRIEFDLLVTLARSPRQVFSREQLMADVWEDETSTHVLDAHLSRLRGKVAAAGGQRVAHAVRGVGFRLRS
jgi:DNA-binding response OmpR family regulator